MTATYLSATEGVLATTVIGPVSAADRGNQTTLLPRSAGDPVPAGTRAIRVNGTATRALPSYNSGYLDNVALTLDITAPPAQPPGNPPPGGDVTAPGLDRLRAVPSTFALAARPTPRNAGRRRVPRGTSLRFRLTEAATVTLSFHRRLAGRRSGSRCVKPTRRNRRAKRCTRHVAVRGKLTRRSVAGANRVRFSGRIGRRALKLGRYRLTARPATSPATTAAGEPPPSGSSSAPEHGGRKPPPQRRVQRDSCASGRPVNRGSGSDPRHRCRPSHPVTRRLHLLANGVRLVAERRCASQ